MRQIDVTSSVRIRIVTAVFSMIFACLSFGVSRAGPAVRENILHAKALTADGMHIIELWESRPEELDKAEGLFKKALSLNPRSAEALAGLGQVALRRQWVSDREVDSNALSAVLDFAERALVIDKKSISAHKLRGRALAFMKDYDGALKEAEKLRELDESACEHFDLRGGVYEMQDRIDIAISEFTSELLCPGVDDARKGAVYGILGNLYLQEKDYDNASVSFEKAIELRPESTLAYAGYSRVLIEQDKLGEAEKMAKKALDIADNKAAHFALALIYHKRGGQYEAQGALDKAEREYFRAIAEYPDFKSAYDRLIYVYGRKGDCRQASKVAMDVLNKYPEDSYAKRVIDYCNKRNMWQGGRK